MVAKKTKSASQKAAAGKAPAAAPSAEEALQRLLRELEPRFEALGARVAEQVTARLADSELVRELVALVAGAGVAPAPAAAAAAAGADDGRVATCAEPGCTEPARARGLCSKHYQRVRAAERRDAESEAKPRRGGGSCSREGCAQTVYARGMCSKHFMEWVRTQKKA